MPPTGAAFWFYLLGLGAGVSFVFQQALNANLRAELGSPWWAGLISYLGGTLVMIAMLVVMREPWLSWSTIQRSELISWTGGIFGAFFIGSSILLVPRLGAATLIALLVAGQLLGALAFDHFGLFGVPVHEIGLVRVIGAGLLIAGAVLIRL
jgi:bacterial/archaeal transporter family-2 protein